MTTNSNFIAWPQQKIIPSLQMHCKWINTACETVKVHAFFNFFCMSLFIFCLSYTSSSSSLSLSSSFEKIEVFKDILRLILENCFFETQKVCYEYYYGIC